MGPGGSASLGFPSSATVSVSKQALTPEELLHHLGKGDLSTFRVLVGGIGLLCTWKTRALSLEKGLPWSWGRVAVDG